MERVTRPQEFKTKVATNTKHAIKTTTATTAATGYQHIDINCTTYPFHSTSPHPSRYPFRPQSGRLCGEKNDRKPDVSACLLCIQRIIQLTCRMCALLLLPVLLLVLLLLVMLLLLLLFLTLSLAFLPARCRDNFKDSCAPVGPFVNAIKTNFMPSAAWGIRVKSPAKA